MKTTERQKPQPKIRKIYNWRELRLYIEDKYECDIRDYAGKFSGNPVDDDAPYQDFWHVMLERLPIRNGAVINVSWTDFLASDFNNEGWVLEIVGFFVAEFGSTNEVEFWW